MSLGLIAQLANLISDKLAEPNQDKSAATQGATGSNLRVFTELSLAGKTRDYNSVNTNPKLYVQGRSGLSPPPPRKDSTCQINTWDNW